MVNIILPPPHFMDGTHVQMLIDRNIGNVNKGSKRWVNKLISRDREEYWANIQILQFQLECLHAENIRIYATMNARKLEKAITLFKHAQVDADTRNNPEYYGASFYFDLHNKMVSCLMQKGCNITNYYLVDVDTAVTEDIQEIERILYKNSIGIAHSYPTPHGYHFLVHSFDTRLFLEIKDVEIKKDSLMLIGY